jgi:hypothetical protein
MMFVMSPRCCVILCDVSWYLTMFCDVRDVSDLSWCLMNARDVSWCLTMSHTVSWCLIMTHDVHLCFKQTLRPLTRFKQVFPLWCSPNVSCGCDVSVMRHRVYDLIPWHFVISCGSFALWYRNVLYSLMSDCFVMSRDLILSTIYVIWWCLVVSCHVSRYFVLSCLTTSSCGVFNVSPFLILVTREMFVVVNWRFQNIHQTKDSPNFWRGFHVNRRNKFQLPHSKQRTIQQILGQFFFRFVFAIKRAVNNTKKHHTNALTSGDRKYENENFQRDFPYKSVQTDQTTGLPKVGPWWSVFSTLYCLWAKQYGIAACALMCSVGVE